MTTTSIEPALWSPSPERVQMSQMAAFARTVAEIDPAAPGAYAKLHAWSVENPARFWSAAWDACGLKGAKGSRILLDADRMPGARFFPDARLNAAENLIERGGAADETLVFWTEAGRRRVWTRRDLKEKSGRFAAALAAAGVRSGDRIAAVMPNMPETVAAFLGSAWIGATFASCAPEFGVEAIVDRLGQIEPRVLVAVAGYRYNGKLFDITPKLQELKYRIPSLEAVVVLPYEGDASRLTSYPSFHLWNDFLAVGEGGGQPYAPVTFDHPLYILFSSGTTGKPKCIVHGTGRALLQHLKEHVLHNDVRARDRVFYYTTTSWMMWNWLVSTLAVGATVLLYDGHPFAADGDVLFELAESERATFFGVSARWIDQVRKDGKKPKDAFELSALRTMASTGSPLSKENYQYVYDAIKADVHLTSISGGTDIVSCFMLGNPLDPVRAGQIQGAGLGMAVEVWDDEGRGLDRGPGELVCTKPFAAMPVGFFDDADGARYQAAYFQHFVGVWRHGDWIERTAEGGFIVHGRSDATLNPGGVRIGTAEIYNQLDGVDQIRDAVAVGQSWDGDQRIVLFVALADGVDLSKGLIAKIKQTIRDGASPRHVPAKVVAVPDVPRTANGKVSELAVRDALEGRPIKNLQALANPEALDYFRNAPSLLEA